MNTSPAPTYPLRVHKHTGQAYIVVAGKRKYLGRHDQPETNQVYRRTVAELLLNGETVSAQPANVTVVELLAAFWEHAKVHYRKPDGRPTTTVEEIRRSAKVLRELYGDTAVKDFGPRALKACRMELVRSGAARSTVNARTSWIRALHD